MFADKEMQMQGSRQWLEFDPRQSVESAKIRVPFFIAILDR
jgi:hypothetical protein